MRKPQIATDRSHSVGHISHHIIEGHFNKKFNCYVLLYSTWVIVLQRALTCSDAVVIAVNYMYLHDVSVHV